MQIDIEDANGTRLGPGPILTGQDWQQTTRLNAAGDFGFTMPALDPRATLVGLKRWARCWEFAEPGGWQQAGYGRIERLGTTYAPDGSAQLQVSGVDALGELADRICKDLSLATYTHFHPVRIYAVLNDVNPVTTTLTYCNDLQVGNTSTSNTLELLNDHNYLRIRSATTFDRITFTIPDSYDSDMGNSQFGANTMLSATYYDKETADWEDLELVDGTRGIRAGIVDLSLAQSGDVTFESPENWGLEPGSCVYELRLEYIHHNHPYAYDITISDIALAHYEMDTDPLGAVMDYAPAGWSLDAANGYTDTQDRPLGTAELLSNGAFETFTGWTVSTPSGAAANIVGGGYENNCLELISTTTWCYVGQTINITAGQDYTLSFWTKGDGTGEAAYKIFAGDYYGVGWDELTEAIDCGVTGTTWTTISKTFSVPVGYTQITVMFFSPIVNGTRAYVDSASLRAGGGSALYLQLRDETVLEALRRIASNTSENFILSPVGKSVLWLGPDRRDSSLRAIAADPLPGTSIPNALLLTHLAEQRATESLVSRIYPYGGGMGAERITLADVTQPVPAGYTLDKAANYLERDAAVAVLGTVECTQQWFDIIPFDKSPTQKQCASNALLWQAWQYLETHGATDLSQAYGDLPRFFSASVVKAERMILPGYTLRLQYDRYRHAEHPVALDLDVWLTAVTQQVGADGVQVIGLELATVPRGAEDDRLLIARNLIRLKDMIAHNSAEGW